MLVSLEWVREYVTVGMPAQKLADMLSMSGTAVDRVTEVGGGVTGVVVARVTGIKPHPNADNLKLAAVDDGCQTMEVVCGAPNLKEGMLSGLALVGATLPAVSNKPLKSAVIRGVKSDGMLVSTAELGMSEDAAGILELETGAAIGADLSDIFPLEDTVLDLEITPNRPDCMSIVGIAREIAALSGAELKMPVIGRPRAGPPITEMVSIDVHAPNECPRYSATALKGVEVRPSPVWMRRRLTASGVRPVNNVVDITNYVLMELGQPLHAFDLDLLEDRRIIVRLARRAETIITLDGIERQLDDRSLVIADAGSAVALAGIMGGEHSGVLDTTTDVLIESAHFDPTAIQLTSKRLGIRTEASARFERGTDIGGTSFAAARAADLVLDYAGGAMAQGEIDVYSKEYVPVTLELRPERVNHVLGTSISEEEVAGILKRLDLVVERGEPLTVKPPSFRRDLEREIDLIEEVARIYGYERIPEALPAGGGMQAGLSRARLLQDSLADSLSAQGFLETIAYSFMRPSDLDAMRIPEGSRLRKAVRLLNPLAETGELMRTTLIPGLLRVTSSNINRGNKNLELFELGRVFFANAEGQPDEVQVLGLLICGLDRIPEWSAPSRKLDFFDLKGALENVAGLLHALLEFAPAPREWMVPGKCASVLLNGDEIGVIGQIHAEVAAGFDIEDEVYAGEVSIAPIIDAARGAVQYSPIGRFPSVKVDIAVIVGESVQEKAVEEQVKASGGKLLADVRLFDVYRGAQVGSGKKSLAFALEFRSPEKTLTDEETHCLLDRIVKELQKSFDASLRGGEGS